MNFCPSPVCKSCLLQRVESGRTFCPQCGIQLQRSRLGEQLKLDHAVQALVYAAVPGLWQEEQRRRKHFVDHHPLCTYRSKHFSLFEKNFVDPMKMCLHESPLYLNPRQLWLHADVMDVLTRTRRPMQRKKNSLLLLLLCTPSFFFASVQCRRPESFPSFFYYESWVYRRGVVSLNIPPLGSPLHLFPPHRRSTPLPIHHASIRDFFFFFWNVDAENEVDPMSLFFEIAQWGVLE